MCWTVPRWSWKPGPRCVKPTRQQKTSMALRTAVAADNLVRAVMTLAARRRG